MLFMWYKNIHYIHTLLIMVGRDFCIQACSLHTTKGARRGRKWERNSSSHAPWQWNHIRPGVTIHSSLSRTEGFASTWGFQCYKQHSPGRTRRVGHLNQGRDVLYVQTSALESCPLICRPETVKPFFHITSFLLMFSRWKSQVIMPTSWPSLTQEPSGLMMTQVFLKKYILALCSTGSML